MKGRDRISQILAVAYVLLLLLITFYEKIAFISGKLFLNLLLLIPMATFYGVFYNLYRGFDDPKARKILQLGLNIGLGLFVILLILVYFLMK